MARRALKLKQDVKQLETVAGRAGADTIRLWEGYRDQALLWRALALLQVPTTLLCLILALVALYTSDPIINVVPDPLPGRYSSRELPDRTFISTATDLVNLISSYQPGNAKRQFRAAERMLWEPALSQFKTDMLEKELRAIVETARSQLFFVDERKIRIKRLPEYDRVVVRLPGTMQKLIGTKPLPAEELVYDITMTTMPRHTKYNRYGIVVVNIDSRNATFSDFE